MITMRTHCAWDYFLTWMYNQRTCHNWDTFYAFTSNQSSPDSNTAYLIMISLQGCFMTRLWAEWSLSAYIARNHKNSNRNDFIMILNRYVFDAVKAKAVKPLGEAVKPQGETAHISWHVHVENHYLKHARYLNGTWIRPQLASIS